MTPRRNEPPEYITAIDAERWGFSVGEINSALTYEGTLRVAFLDSDSVAYFKLTDVLALYEAV